MVGLLRRYPRQIARSLDSILANHYGIALIAGIVVVGFVLPLSICTGSMVQASTKVIGSIAVFVLLWPGTTPVEITRGDSLVQDLETHSISQTSVVLGGLLILAPIILAELALVFGYIYASRRGDRVYDDSSATITTSTKTFFQVLTPISFAIWFFCMNQTLALNNALRQDLLAYLTSSTGPAYSLEYVILIDSAYRLTLLTGLGTPLMLASLSLLVSVFMSEIKQLGRLGEYATLLLRILGANMMFYQLTFLALAINYALI